VTTEEVRKVVVRHAVHVVTARRTALTAVRARYSSHVRTYSHQPEPSRQPVTAVSKVSCPTQDSTGVSIAEEGRVRQFSAREVQADLQSVNRVEGP